jgi:hypothetical protein
LSARLDSTLKVFAFLKSISKYAAAVSTIAFLSFSHAAALVTESAPNTFVAASSAASISQSPSGSAYIVDCIE